MLRIKLVRSKAGSSRSHNATLAALGLRKMQQSVEKEDIGSIRGMIHKVRHMVQVEEFEGAPKKAAKEPKKEPAAAAATAEEAPVAKAPAKSKAAPKPKTPAKKAKKGTQE